MYNVDILVHIRKTHGDSHYLGAPSKFDGAARLLSTWRRRRRRISFLVLFSLLSFSLILVLDAAALNLGQTRSVWCITHRSAACCLNVIAFVDFLTDGRREDVHSSFVFVFFAFIRIFVSYCRLLPLVFCDVSTTQKQKKRRRKCK